MLKNPYFLLGIILAVAGAVLAPVFYFIIGSPPLTAVGISAVILGITCIAIANARPYLSPEAARLLLRTGIENTAALLEELGLSHKAVYLPPDGSARSRAVIPLEASYTGFPQSSLKSGSYNRLIVRYGSGATDMAISVVTAGSVSLELLENQPGSAESDIEAALNYLLTGVLDIARGTSVNIAGRDISVQIKDARMGYANVWYYRSLGSPVASIAAAVTAAALGRPVRIKEESEADGKTTILLETLAS